MIKSVALSFLTSRMQFLIGERAYRVRCKFLHATCDAGAHGELSRPWCGL